MSSDCNEHCAHSNSSCRQTLEELEFERGPWYAAQYGDMARLQLLFSRGVHVDARDQFGYTALHYAARAGHLEVCKYLLSNGAKVNAVTKCGQASPLHRAASAGKLEIVKLLIERRANLKLKDSDGKTVLHRAAESGHKQICELIIKNCPELKNDLDSKSKRPFDYAIDLDLATILD